MEHFARIDTALASLFVFNEDMHGIYVAGIVVPSAQKSQRSGVPGPVPHPACSSASEISS
jgi:hypothetical protein